MDWMTSGERMGKRTRRAMVFVLVVVKQMAVVLTRAQG